MISKCSRVGRLSDALRAIARNIDAPQMHLWLAKVKVFHEKIGLAKTKCCHGGKPRFLSLALLCPSRAGECDRAGHPSLVGGNPCFSLHGTREAANGRGMSIGDRYLDGEGSIGSSNDAIAGVSVGMLPFRAQAGLSPCSSASAVASYACARRRRGPGRRLTAAIFRQLSAISR